MKEQKATLDQIFKDGKDFKFKKVDYSTDEVGRETARLEKKQEEIRQSAYVDLNDPKLRKPFDI
jgi:cytochrome c556